MIDFWSEYADEFWATLSVTPECWISSDTGYGVFRRKGRRISAHRLAYLLTHKHIPDNNHVLHTCDVRGCANPKHLFSGTSRDNMRDMLAKGRHYKQTWDACPKGHSYADHGFTDSRGSRQCAPCATQRKRNYKLRKRNDQ